MRSTTGCPTSKAATPRRTLKPKTLRLSTTHLNLSAWRSGYVVGAGIEYALAANWIFGVEYNYMDFGGKAQSGMTISELGIPFNEDTFNDA